MPRVPSNRQRNPAAPETHVPDGQLSAADYRSLAEFRYLLRRFLAFSEAAAQHAGLTPRHHQALLAIKAFAGDAGMAIQDLAERLAIRHHSAVELVDRLAEAGLVRRRADQADRRRVRLQLTPAAERRLAALSAIHLQELHRLRPALQEILAALDRSATETVTPRGADGGRC